MPRHFSTGAPITRRSLRLASYPHFPQPGGDDPRDRFSFMGGLPPPKPPASDEAKEGAQANIGPKNEANPYTKRAQKRRFIKVKAANVSKT